MTDVFMMQTNRRLAHNRGSDIKFEYYTLFNPPRCRAVITEGCLVRRLLEFEMGISTLSNTDEHTGCRIFYQSAHTVDEATIFPLASKSDYAAESHIPQYTLFIDIFCCR